MEGAPRDAAEYQASRLVGRFRGMTWIRKHAHAVTCAAIVVCAAVVICAAVGVAVVKLPRHSSPSESPDPARRPQPIRYLGVYAPPAPRSYSGVEEFAHAVGRQPNLVSYYSGWGESFKQAFAQTAASHGSTTIVQVDPTEISIASIAAGMYDHYLNQFAHEVAAFKHPVVISFGHEMNGDWYSWGYRSTSPGVFIAAWRHIVDLFRRNGADNVKWLWQVNSLSSRTSPVQPWWPGSQYVTWVGISGYYYVPGATFDYIFNPVVTAVRQLTKDPVLIAETGVGPQAGQVRGIKDLFAGIRLQGDIGLVYFDRHAYGGIYKGEDWRLEDSPSALAAFRNALKGK
jgi:mannan endo-1,4-beta-mannosidase